MKVVEDKGRISYEAAEPGGVYRVVCASTGHDYGPHLAVFWEGFVNKYAFVDFDGCILCRPDDVDNFWYYPQEWEAHRVG